MAERSMKLGEIERHFWLTRSVARVMGVNLSEAMAEGRLSASDYCEMVTQCRAGDCHETCQHWLGSQTEMADEAPQGCMHRDVLSRLRRI